MAGAAPTRERVHVCRRGEEPSGTPGHGHPLREVAAFEPSSARTTRLPKIRHWSERRIERELRGWRGELTTWPEYGEFFDDGRSRLHLQVLEWGGRDHWIRRLGWTSAERRRRRWNEEGIRRALRPHLAGRKAFPGRVEFARLGATNIFDAARKHGGIEHWAREFGIAPDAAELARTSAKRTEP